MSSSLVQQKIVWPSYSSATLGFSERHKTVGSVSKAERVLLFSDKVTLAPMHGPLGMLANVKGKALDKDGVKQAIESATVLIERYSPPDKATSCRLKGVFPTNYQMRSLHWAGQALLSFDATASRVAAYLVCLAIEHGGPSGVPMLWSDKGLRERVIGWEFAEGQSFPQFWAFSTMALVQAHCESLKSAIEYYTSILDVTVSAASKAAEQAEVLDVNMAELLASL